MTVPPFTPQLHGRQPEPEVPGAQQIVGAQPAPENELSPLGQLQLQLD